MFPKILPNAVFVADAHYNPLGRLDLIEFLEAVLHSKPPQLFLLGDISDLLIGVFKYCVDQNKTLIDLINRIAKSGVEVWYFEGNHDFMLEGVFCDKVNIVSSQPKIFDLEGKKVALLHGDYGVDLSYTIYAKVIRSRAVVAIANIVSFNFLNSWVLKKIQKDQMKKRQDYKIENFFDKRKGVVETIAKSADVVVEGHFHQDISETANGIYYRNLPAFACGKSFARVQSSHNSAKISSFVFRSGGDLE